ncbi:hypothetical protein [Pseudozobellia thermophila]|uniref:Uncharacterized protein n=1 Tax=Pseudozobellia thermophila TaxID=192903 RepID=A0A1M6PEP4_9FLAO|nr:hypothetical protein [Pseudozobellia thermophila]SHK06362.1 hypothetical protein SAMN04488513_12020 [Pseudozobellia thermophila]
MDLVLELCMEYYTGKEQKIDFYKVEAKLCDNLGLHSWESEFLLDIMSDKGYIKEEYNENKALDKIYAKPKGIKIFINGGFEIEARRKKNERILIKIAQWSSAIVGLYYLLLLLKEFFGLNTPTFKEIYCWLIGLF